MASATCYTLRLHVSAAPPRGGLTQALGGRKALELFVFQHGDLAGFGWCCSSVSSSARCFFGHVRVARSHIACVTFTGFGICGFFRSVLWLQTRSLRRRPAENSRVRAQASGLRFSAGPLQLYPRRLPSRLTSRSSRPRIVASTACFALRCTLLPPRCGSA